jgi:Tfp pilus assembly protein PilW
MSQRTLPRSEAGMSLVELMVAMLIGLIGIVIITHLYVTNDQYKRSTTGAGSAQVNGAIALYTLERELRMAGYGFNHPAAQTCSCALPNCSRCSTTTADAKSSFPPAGAAGRRAAAARARSRCHHRQSGRPGQHHRALWRAQRAHAPGRPSPMTRYPTNHDY